MAGLGVRPELAFLGQVAAGAYGLVGIDEGDIAIRGRLIEKYKHFNLALADASVALLAARADTTNLLTFGERHLRAIAPPQGSAFKLARDLSEEDC